MKLVGTLEQSIYHPVWAISNDNFKDELVDKILKIRDDVEDKYGTYPVMAMSKNTFVWFKRLFGKDSSYKETLNDVHFWLMNIAQLDMRDGLIDFYIDNSN